MDPNANLEAQEKALASIVAAIDKAARNEIRENLRDLRSDLLCWLRNGGFAPNWSACPNASQYFGIKAGV